MANFRNFLESSTIHGLNYISTTRKLVKLLWILVVIAGFTGAGVMIYQSFQDWDENPVKTTIDTLPIAQLKFPKVTVCPPKDTYTDLNLIMDTNITLDNVTRSDLTNYAVQLLFDNLHDELLANLSLVQDTDRYFNWYHGFTKITLPFPNGPQPPKKPTSFSYGFGGSEPILSKPETYDIYYEVATYAASGFISTQHFGDKFVVDKIVPNIRYKVTFKSPLHSSMQDNKNVTLNFEIKKLSLMGLPSGEDSFSFTDSAKTSSINEDEEYIDADVETFVKNYTPPEPLSLIRFRGVQLIRNIKIQDVKALGLEIMPGFQIKWYYTTSGSYEGFHRLYNIQR